MLLNVIASVHGGQHGPSLVTVLDERMVKSKSLILSNMDVVPLILKVIHCSGAGRFFNALLIHEGEIHPFLFPPLHRRSEVRFSHRTAQRVSGFHNKIRDTISGEAFYKFFFNALLDNLCPSMANKTKTICYLHGSTMLY